MRKLLFISVFVLLFFPKMVEAKTKKVDTELGKAVIKESSFGKDFLKVTCNNGLVIEADWESSTNESGFGYDLIDVRVSEDFDEFTVYLIVRGIIANYLNGEYD